MRLDSESDFKLLEWLLTLDGIDWNSVNDDGDTPLLCVYPHLDIAYAQHFDKVTKLLTQSNKADLRFVNKKGHSIMRRAIKENSVGIVKFVLAVGIGT